jgi:hypothetical protein
MKKKKTWAQKGITKEDANKSITTARKADLEPTKKWASLSKKG